jgi:hypothetical protein
VYINVAKSLFYWTEPESTEPGKVHTVLKADEEVDLIVQSREELQTTIPNEETYDDDDDDDDSDDSEDDSDDEGKNN